MTEHNSDTLEGLQKQTYGNSLEKAVPECSILGSEIPLQPADEAPGGGFNQPIRLTRSHGWTLNGTSGGAYALNEAEAARSQNATLVGSSFTMEERIGYDEVARLLKSKGETRKRAFVNATSYLYENMLETAAFVRELQLLYGTAATGTIETGGVTDNGDGTAEIIITKATVIYAMLAGLENGFIDVYNGSTQINTAGNVQVTSFDSENRTLYISGPVANLASISAGHNIYLRGTKANGMTGLLAIAANSGTLWTIDGSATGYSLFGGNTYTAESGPLIYSKVLKALNKPISKAGLSGDVKLLVSPFTWTDTMNDLSAVRRDSVKNGGSLEMGSKSITLHSQNGSVEVTPHMFMQPGTAVAYPKGKAKRIGPYDTTFKLPGQPNDMFFENLPGNAGYAVRCYWNQALFLPCPAKCVKITNIVNSDDA